MNLLIAYSYHLNKSLETLILLKEYQDSFEIESLVLRSAKCNLLNNSTLEDYVLDGEVVNVSNNGDDYELNYRDYIFHLETKEKIILSYYVEKW